jgi:hypothetical protein
MTEVLTRDIAISTPLANVNGLPFKLSNTVKIDKDDWTWGKIIYVDNHGNSIVYKFQTSRLFDYWRVSRPEIRNALPRHEQIVPSKPNIIRRYFISEDEKARFLAETGIYKG